MCVMDICVGSAQSVAGRLCVGPTHFDDLIGLGMIDKGC
jgi:hypothetical protein